MLELMKVSFFETIYTVVLSTIFSILLGFPLGVILNVTEENGLLENRGINKLISSLINIFRSIPFLILIVMLFPISRKLVGTSIGPKATIVPLSIATAPFVARLIEANLKEVDKGLIELGLSLGASNKDIICRILIPESLPAIISSFTVVIINIIGYSAMAGAIGGGGLGDLALQYGHFRGETDVLYLAVIIIVILVQIVQYSGNKLANFANKK